MVRKSKLYIRATTIAIPLFSLLLFANCAGPGQRPAQDVKFIIVGNTGPASPFSGNPERLPSVYKSINHENVVLVIHTGNMIHGGHEWMGITRNDIVKQYRNVLKQNKTLTGIVHILPGEMDRYNGKTDLFERYISKKLYYTFNFADSHFILLNITNKDQALSPEQMKWLHDDLERNKNRSAIFVFSHYPVLPSQQGGMRSQNGEELHALFARYPVKAVISGSAKNFQEFERDGIRYVTAGCSGFNNESQQWGFNQYYIAHYDGYNFTVRGVKMNFPVNVHRPKPPRG